MSTIARIVQFPHPGSEHTPKTESMRWNLGLHRRKFLAVNGKSVHRDRTLKFEGPLSIWGEWEPPSQVRGRWAASGELPTVLHEPYWEAAPPNPECQNSDPWVFGPTFLYSNCRQLTSHNNPSILQRLEAGSLILFGSTLHGAFVIDTVFVVGDAGTKYSASDNVNRGPEAFRECTVKPLATYLAFTQRQNSTFTLYAGASPEHPVNDIFSFSPCLPATDGYIPFARPAIEVPEIIDPKRWRSTGGAKVPRHPEEIVHVWNLIAQQVERCDLDLGTNFAIPPRH
jgi:hypothetical protein